MNPKWKDKTKTMFEFKKSFSIALKIVFNRFLNHQFHNESLHFALQL